MAWTYTESGNNTASTSWGITFPVASTGDLIIVNLAWDDSTNVTSVSAPSGPNGETFSNIQGPQASNSTNNRGQCWYTVATGSWSAGNLTFTPNASEQWTATVIKVPSGEFDSTTPIGASNYLASTTTSNPSLPSLTAGSTDGGGTVVGFISSDVDDADGTVSGWTTQVSTDRGAIGIDIVTRDTTATNSESISSASGWTYPSARSWVSFIYIVRALANDPPTVSLSSPSNAGSTSDTTPDLTFTGTDPDSDDISYEVQVDTVNTFDSQGGGANMEQGVADNAGGYVQTPTIQFSGNTTTGNTILVSVTYNDDVTGNVSSITDTTSNSYAKIAGGSSGGDTYTELWYAYNITGGTTPTITVNMSNANYHDFTITAREISGLMTTDPFDVKAEGAVSAGTSHTSATTATTSQANELVYSVIGLAGNTTYTAGSGFGDLSQTNGSDLYQSSASQMKVVSSAGTQTATITSANSLVGYFIVATFKIDAGPLIDKLSDTDSGFSGSPDNTDPFSSGQAVTYTVQAGDELISNNTYYWRVRGKDPSGSNTWGDWSSTYSFEVTSGGGTSIKDIIGGFIPFAR